MIKGLTDKKLKHCYVSVNYKNMLLYFIGVYNRDLHHEKIRSLIKTLGFFHFIENVNS